MNLLENWGVVSLQRNPYQAPEMAAKGLSGEVFNSEKFEDGATITTTEIVGAEVCPGGVQVRTASGSVYELGTVNADYEKQYPGALERMLKSLITRENK
jgi:hypothetical protein